MTVFLDWFLRLLFGTILFSLGGFLFFQAWEEVKERCWWLVVLMLLLSSFVMTVGLFCLTTKTDQRKVREHLVVPCPTCGQMYEPGRSK
jgi:hypothetical protein